MSDLTGIDAAIRHAKSNAERFLDELIEFLRIPSISAQPSHTDDMRAAANWVAGRCRTAGLSAEVVETDGHPAVISEGEQRPGRPTVLVYGHYDVQPEGDVALWETGPFEPVVRDGRIVCRGAADDKGQVMCAILAAECWNRAAGALPVNVKFLLEGEEEIGSKHFGAVLRAHRQRLACDYVLIHDTPQFDEGVPAVTTATKGLIYKEVIVHGPKKDLHSGSFGGMVANPANELAQLIASLTDDEGRIDIPGFLDDVKEMTAEEVAMMEALPFDEGAVLEDLGSPRVFGDPTYSTLYRRWARPTLDVNGIYGGYMKEGSSTIIPSAAGAKISMRIVADQRADEISRRFDEAIRSRTPNTVRVEIRDHASCDPYLADVTSPGMEAARQAMERGFGTAPVLVREGGSLPILPMFKEVLGADSLMMGYCLPTCNAHSPNEFFHVRDFEAGIRSTAAFLGLLAGVAPVGDRR